ncbi:hypothetical protein MVEN_01854700 [Mycena venus]|uniref:F-box domain-containing protein n=1 Tax=Mycena venus TaxID=2733690 RepID=A0A8H6XIX8_9AGAR|nr:hypothetical protein MVEN_01854700 [Mycena venus]
MSSHGGSLAYGLPPEISRLLYTNDPRVDYQVAEIKNSLGIARTLKDELGLKITQLRMDLVRLEREELHATRHISRCEFALAPVRRVPPEILSEIFHCYVDLLGDQHECVDVKHGVWLLAHICSYWRTVALSTPQLWSSCGYACDTRVRNVVPLIQAWLKHAANHPLSIRFRCTTNTFPNHRAAVCQCPNAVKAFAEHHLQWSELNFCVPASFYSHRAFEHTFPILRKLKITAFLSQVILDNMITILTVFATNVPQLREVSLHDFAHWPVRMILPWKQLTSYSGAVIANASILKNSPDLLECTFYPSARADVTPSFRLTEPLVHSNLRHLHLHFRSLRPELVTLPALQSLRLSADDISILQSVERLLQRSMASPVSLTIDDFGFSPELVAVLAAAPSVAHLTICAIANETISVSVTDQFFAFFMEGADTPPLLPGLRTLTIQNLVFGETFVRMVRSRCISDTSNDNNNAWMGNGTTGHLESLTIADVGDTHISHLLDIKRLRSEAGLKLFGEEALAAVRILG